MLHIHQGSAYDLHGRMGEELPDDRWRPNIVVEGADAWSEDLWERFTVSNAQQGTSIEMVSVRPCDRCKVKTASLISAQLAKDLHIPLKAAFL